MHTDDAVHVNNMLACGWVRIGLSQVVACCVLRMHGTTVMWEQGFTGTMQKSRNKMVTLKCKKMLVISDKTSTTLF